MPNFHIRINPPLARQKYWQIRTNFTTLLLHNYNLKLDCEDYSKNLLASLTCLAFLQSLEVFNLQSVGIPGSLLKS
jgi:hypothetical protein